MKKIVTITILAMLILGLTVFGIYKLNKNKSDFIQEKQEKTADVDLEILNKKQKIGPFEINLNDVSTVPWNIKDEQLRSYGADIQKLNFLRPLYNVYNATKDTKYLIPAKNICLEWIRIHQKDNKDLSMFTWWEMIDGLRANVLSKIYISCKNEKLLAEQEDKMFLNSLKEHAEHIMDEKNINYRNNHGFFQISNQMVFSYDMKNFDPIFEKSYRQSQKRLNKIMKMQFFLKDGVHKENSPGYNYWCFLDMDKLNKTVPLTNAQKNFVKRMKENMYWFLLPNSRMPNIGDTMYSMEIYNAQDFNKNNSGKTYKVFKESGYYVVKKAQSYLIQHAGFMSITHKHCDDLTIFWYDLGQEILMDSGMYGYSGGHFPKGSIMSKKGFWYTNPNRIYVETTRAHNTLEFNDDDNYRKQKKDFYKNAIKDYGYNKKEDYYYQTAEVNLRGKIFERTLYYSPEKYLVIHDKYNSKKEEIKTVKQWFHLAPDLTIEKAGESYIINLKNNNKIKVTQLSKDAKADRLYKAEKEPRMQGWISLKTMNLEPNYAFNYEIKNKNQGEFITIFEINNNKVSDNILNSLRSFN